MSKVVYSVILSLFFFLFFSAHSVLAANCGNTNLGITYEPQHFSVDSSTMTMRFNVSNPNTLSHIKFARLRFGQSGVGFLGDIYVPDTNGQAVNSPNFEITINGVDDRILKQVKEHPGELQWEETQNGWTGNSCPITYTVDQAAPIASNCQLDSQLKTEYPPNSPPITVQFGGTPNTNYYLYIIPTVNVPISSAYIRSTTTNSLGQGTFSNVLLRGNHNEEFQLIVDIQQDSSKLTGLRCEKNITITAAASPVKSICYFKQFDTAVGPTANLYGIKAINLLPNSTYFSELNGKYNSTAGNLTTDSSSTELMFNIGPKPAPGDYSAIVKDLSGAEMCPKVDFTIEDDGDIISSSPTIPTGPVTKGSSGSGSVVDCKTNPKSCTSSAGTICPVTDKQKANTKNVDGPDKWTGIQTAIGCVPTDPTELIPKLLKLASVAGGGIALLLMITGAFQMITSAGNPDSLKAGQGRFTSAIVGLLFVIFSVLLLQIIGVDILSIPGFGK